MKLEKLTQENIIKLKNSKVICYERALDYLTELEDEFELLFNVEFILDDFARNQGTLKIKGFEIPVVGTETLECLSLEEYEILITSDYYRDCFDKLSGTDSVTEGRTVVYYFANKETEVEDAYRKKYEFHPLENIIVFRSGPHASSYVEGTDFADNARALFEYMIQQGYNERYELVWLVKNPLEYEQYSKYKNVQFLSFDAGMSDQKEERDSYYRVLCLAKYFFFTDAYGFVRNCREDQVRVQLWHGCGFKTRVNFVRCEKRYEYTTVVSELYANIHANIYGLRKEQVLVTGYAKQDWLRQPYEDDMGKMLGKKASKYIFWLPTFRTAQENLAQLNEQQKRTETGLPVVTQKLQMEELNHLLQELNVLLIIKLHPFQKDLLISDCAYSNIVLLRNADMINKDWIINRLLASASALISDYSSAAVDFLALDRPIAFTLDDVEEYKSSRGFVFDNIENWLPGREIFKFEDFCNFIIEIAKGQDATKEKRAIVAAELLKYKDGENCKRILEALGL